jgi:hypothetical protein
MAGGDRFVGFHHIMSSFYRVFVPFGFVFQTAINRGLPHQRPFFALSDIYDNGGQIISLKHVQVSPKEKKRVQIILMKKEYNLVEKKKNIYIYIYFLGGGGGGA